MRKKRFSGEKSMIPSPAGGESPIGRTMPSRWEILCVFRYCPMLLLYLPYYLLTGGPLQNYGGICLLQVIIAAAGLS
ncbi:MAG: hypothetical protein ACLURV_04130 [Gallintestinimicrobium sp.]